MGIACYHIEKAKISGPKECESQIKEEKYEEGKIKGAEEMKPLDETNHKEKGKCICKINGKSIGTGFFCKIKYKDSLIPVLFTNYHVVDEDFIESKKKLKFYMKIN